MTQKGTETHICSRCECEYYPDHRLICPHCQHEDEPSTPAAPEPRLENWSKVCASDLFQFLKHGEGRKIMQLLYDQQISIGKAAQSIVEIFELHVTPNLAQVEGATEAGAAIPSRDTHVWISNELWDTLNNTVLQLGLQRAQLQLDLEKAAQATESLRRELEDSQSHRKQETAALEVQRENSETWRKECDKQRERADKAEAELAAARHEASCCDDIKLDQPLEGVISDLQHERERLERLKEKR